MLLTRVLTALALIPLVVWAVLALPVLGLSLLLAVVVTLSAWEWSQFAVHARWQRLAFALLLAAAVVFVPVAATPVALAGVGFWLLMTGWLWAYPRGFVAGVGQPVVRLAVGGGLLWLFAAGAAALAALEQGRVVVLVTLVLVWAMDVGGYFAGKRYGRRKLAPLVSPNKSWEGFYGGLALALLVALLAVAFVLQLHARQAIVFVILALLVSSASVIGDLVESMFKRQSGIKDSGTLLPGHGGLLDRLDSSYAALPLMLAGWLLLQSF